MPKNFWKQFVSSRKFEFVYTTAGTLLGTTIFVGGVFLDSRLRLRMGLDPSLTATFLSTSVHAINILAPLLLGRISYSVGATRARLEASLRMARETELMSRERASLDVLTGLFNRAYLLSTLEEGLATGEWSRRGALLMLLDLDGFKSINDTHGHPTGDHVLRVIGRRIRARCAASDLVVRLGGDEFVVVHFPQPDAPEGEAFAAGLLEAVAGEIAAQDTRIVPRTSIGIARVGADGATCSDVLKAADLALYTAKQQRTGIFRHFDLAMRTERDRRRQLERELRAAIDGDDFFLQYQPIYGTASGKVRSFEALVRWRHPELGLVPPLEFVPLAESTGLIVKLGRRILREACRAAANWPKPIGVSVNLSPLQFNDPDLVSCVAEALRQTNLAPGRLDLEITESLLLEATQSTHRTIHELKQLGVRITMDDFGTGYSGLSSLRNFPFDRLKIDRSFTRDLGIDAEDEEIVRAIVRLSRAMRMETVLEGVETEEQMAFARAEGLTEVQGYLFAKPLSCEAATALVVAPGARPVAQVA